MADANKSRREVLEQFVAQKPTDAFARYGLALECVKLGDNEAASGHFVKLLETNPDYSAGYFQFGQLLSRLGRLEEARKTLSDGTKTSSKTTIGWEASPALPMSLSPFALIGVANATA